MDRLSTITDLTLLVVSIWERPWGGGSSSTLLPILQKRKLRLRKV